MLYRRKMKLSVSILLLFCAGFFITSCQSSNNGSDAPKKYKDEDRKPINIALTHYPEQYPVFSVADTAYDFGTIAQNDVVEYKFRFKNTGTKPLIIGSASSTCGCTIPQYPKKPIAPGEEGILKVVFNSAGKSGRQVKPINISANTMPARFNLKITCDVTSK